MADEDLNIDVNADADGQESIRDMIDLLKDLRQHALDTNLLLEAQAMIMISTAVATTAAIEALQKITPAQNSVSSSTNNATQSFVSFLSWLGPGGSGPVIGGLILLLIALAGVFAPFTAAVVDATVVTIAFGVGVLAAATTSALALAPMLAIAAGMAAIGIAAQGGIDPVAALEKATTQLTAAQERQDAAITRLQLAQIAYDTKPTEANLIRLKAAQDNLIDANEKLAVAQDNVTKATANSQSAWSAFREDLSVAGTAISTLVVPMANQIFTFLDGMLPRVVAAGQSISDWFGQRLPDVLRIVGTAMDGVMGVIGRLATVFGVFIDVVFTEMPRFGALWQGIGSALVAAVDGILTNLLRLSDWFFARMPAMTPIVQATLAEIGVLIQGLGTVLGGLVDFFISAWPSITASMDWTWKSIQAGWAMVAPALQLYLPFALDQIGVAFRVMTQHAELVQMAFGALGIVAAGTIVAFFLLVQILTTAVAVLSLIEDAFHRAAIAVAGFLERFTILAPLLALVPALHESVARATDQSAQAASRHAVSVNSEMGSLRDLETQMSRTEAAYRAMMSAQNASVQADLAFERAQMSVSTAQQRLNQDMQGGAASALTLAGDQLSLKDAMLQSSIAAATSAEEQAALKGGHLAAAEAAHAQAGELERLKEQAGGVLPAELQTLLDKLNQFTSRTVTISFNAVGGLPTGPIRDNLAGSAEGGIFTRPTLTVVGESGPEAVVPLTPGNRMPGARPLTTSDMGGTADQSVTVNVTAQTNANPFDIANEIVWAMKYGGQPA